MAMNRSLFIFAFSTLIISSCTKDSFERDYSIPKSSATKVALSEEQTEYMNSGNQFSLNLLNTVYDGSDVVLSPLSLQMALAMSLNGASGETASEIITALSYNTNNEKNINEYCKLLMEQLPSIDQHLTLKILNGIVTDEAFVLNKSFMNTLREYYYAPAESYPFRSPETLERINNWAGRNTDWQVYPLLERLPDNAVAVILDAIYFKARWSNSLFKNAIYENRDFIHENGEKSEMKYMCATHKLPYYSSDVFQMVELPYSERKYSLFVLLPRTNNNGSCMNLTKNMRADEFRTVLSSVQYKNVGLSFPKFEIKSSLKLKEYLKIIGIKRAFIEGQADFFKMVENNRDYESIWIDNVYQKTSFKVNEWGTEAASATAVVYSGKTADHEDEEDEVIEFNANHPFVFFVIEKGTGAILFEGVFTGNDR